MLILTTELINEEIKNASNIIDKNLERLNDNNRGEISTNILNSVRNLNDIIAYKIWKDKFPDKPMDINKVASRFTSVSGCQFIAHFDKCLRKSLSHFTPSEEGAMFLLSKYYKYIYQLKQVMKEIYNIDIIKNIDLYFENKIDAQSFDYYTKIAKTIDNSIESPLDMDIYYIHSSRPFRIKDKLYYEVVLEPAEEVSNKFNRITAFTKFDIDTNYAVALQLENKHIDLLGKAFPIVIITKWQISIRPCELINFGDLINCKINIQRSYPEYQMLMKILTNYNINLLDIIMLDRDDYLEIKTKFENETKNKHSKIFDLLDICHEIISNKKDGQNVLRYLLVTMNNRIIKLQRKTYGDSNYANCNISSKCMPFDKMPFTFSLKKHRTDFYTLLNCIDLAGKKPDIFAHHIISSSEQYSTIFIPFSALYSYGDENNIKELVRLYNNKLDSYYKPTSELRIYKDKVYYNENFLSTKEIITVIEEMSTKTFNLRDCFNQNDIDLLKNDFLNEIPLEDCLKEKVLQNIYNKSQVHIIYGAAGTGKSTLVNYISNLLSGYNKIFLAKTNSAVENLRRRIQYNNINDSFMTIDKFISTYKRYLPNANLIVVDECSTVENVKMKEVLKRVGDSLLILTGDIYQIESIGFGNWFALLKDFLPDYCITELETTYRSSNHNLKELWAEVRKLGDEENEALESLIRCSYSSEINTSIFDYTDREDEIILCLNYNGLYGLNNINKLLQLSQSGKKANIGIWQFRVGDPILFTDSERFHILYNNLKGKIVDIDDQITSVKFTIEVNIGLNEDEVYSCDGLEYISSDKNRTILSFYVDRHKPYYFDNEPENKKHVLPFQVAYAVSIHKSQGLEYNSVKIVISNESENKITHDIFYTAITRARNHLKIYWPYTVANKILSTIKPKANNDSIILKLLLFEDKNNFKNMSSSE